MFVSFSFFFDNKAEGLAVSQTQALALESRIPSPSLVGVLHLELLLGKLGPRLDNGFVVGVIVAIHSSKAIRRINRGVVRVGTVLEGFPVAGRVGRRGAVAGDAAQARAIVLLVLDSSSLLLHPQGHTKGRRKGWIDLSLVLGV